MKEVLAGLQSTTLRRFRSLEGKLFAHSWRCCGQCVLEQEYTFGIGHWLVVHQLPGIVTCPFHGARLLGSCAGCGHSLGNAGQLTLPSDPCLQCGSTKRQSVRFNQSAGAEDLGQFYLALLAGAAIDLSPATRLDHSRSLVGMDRSKGATSALATEFLAAYGVRSPRQLSEQLDVSLDDRDLDTAVSGRLPCPAALQLAMGSFLLSKYDVASGSDEFRAPAEHFEVTSAEATLFERADARGFPREAVERILAGELISALERDRVTTAIRWRTFVAALPANAMRALRAAGAAIPNERVSEIIRTKGVSDAELRTKYRARILEFLGPDMGRRDLYTGPTRAAVRWCVSHDLEWLNATCPNKQRRKPKLNLDV